MEIDVNLGQKYKDIPELSLLSFLSMSVPIIQNLVLGYFLVPLNLQGKENTVRKPMVKGAYSVPMRRKKNTESSLSS